jgi:hypothetical protein
MQSNQHRIKKNKGLKTLERKCVVTWTVAMVMGSIIWADTLRPVFFLCGRIVEEGSFLFGCTKRGFARKNLERILYRRAMLFWRMKF